MKGSSVLGSTVKEESRKLTYLNQSVTQNQRCSEIPFIGNQIVSLITQNYDGNPQ
jgi:hypothetical protein